MRNRVRLGAAAAVALGALLLATVLASPALAWHSNVTAEAKCLDDGQVQVDYTVSSWEEGHEAYVKVFYTLNGEKTDLEPGKFDKDHSEFSDSFVLPAGTTGTVIVHAVAFWKDGKEIETSKNESKPVELPEDCKGHESSTSTSKSTTSTSESTTTTTTPSTTETSVVPTTESSVAPTTSIEETTTTAAVGAATSTTAGRGQLPFTGASSGPILLAGIVLVGGGSLVLLLTRAKGGHATR